MNRPTVNSIWNSFRSSGKRHLLLTGSFGSGKTTLLSELFDHPLPGITTWAEPQQAVYLKENGTETCVEIARYDATLTGMQPNMVLSSDGFVDVGVPALERCMQTEGDWVSIDEIGFLEGTCQPYQNAIRNVMAHKRVAAVVRKQDLPFLNELREREDVFLVDLDQPYGQSGCVIMASGMSRRFGENKLLADFFGQPLITQILDATEGVFSKRVVVTRHEEIAAICEERAISVILHDLPHRSDTIRIGLEVIGEVKHCMFCQADQPLLSPDTISSLLLAAQNAPEQIWRTCGEQGPGSPVLFPKWMFSELLTLPEGKGGGWALKKYPDNIAMLPVSDPYELIDADTPNVLEQLRRYARNIN